VLNARTKSIHVKARWVRGNLGYPIRQCIELVLRDPAWGERGLGVFIRTSMPGLHAALQWLSAASQLAVALLAAVTVNCRRRLLRTQTNCALLGWRKGRPSYNGGMNERRGRRCRRVR
jgi:hypothetical protein